MKSLEKICVCCEHKFVALHAQRQLCDDCWGDQKLLTLTYYEMRSLKKDMFHLVLYNPVEADLVLEEMREDVGYHMVACLLNKFSEWIVDYKFIDTGELARMQVISMREYNRRIHNVNTHNVADLRTEEGRSVLGENPPDGSEVQSE